ncbi:MAG TPA: ATPase P [Casimicrobiaceae bacterium]
MVDVTVPGFGRLALTHLVCDFNGTLARDGRMLDRARLLLPAIAKVVDIRIITGNTFGSATEELRGCPCEVLLLRAKSQARAKKSLVERIGREHVVAIGNGRNDRLMLKAAALGIGVIGDEGLARETAQACDVITRRIDEALALLLEPRRLIATLRG